MDRIKTCRSCELRYACYDCRILEEILEGEIKGKRKFDEAPITREPHRYFQFCSF